MDVSNTAFLPYLNLAMSLRMDYPAGWQVREQSAPQAFAAAFISPQESPSDVFAENVVLVVEPIAPDTTAESYTAGCMQAMRNGAIQFLGEPQRQQIGGLAGYRVNYSVPLQGPAPLAGKALLVLFVHAERGFTLTYTAEASHYNNFSAAVEQMIGTLTVS